MAGVVEVAVAVLCYEGAYLVARRGSHQHQGDKLEFVGGKIEQAENETQALAREVAEELGLDINGLCQTKLGEICHDYGDKTVCLKVYQVELSSAEYNKSRQSAQGRQGQALYWLDRQMLLALVDEFPKANAKIFEWL